MSTSTDAYLICATPRSGSTLLCGLLRSTGVAGRPESYFRAPDEQSWADRWQLVRGPAGGFEYQRFVRAAIAAGSTPNGVFGARVMWGTMDEIVARLASSHTDVGGADLDLLTRAFGRTRFVHLRRDDTVAQAVSWARAEQTGFWHPGDPAQPWQRPRFDFEQIDALVQTIREHDRAWRDWFDTAGVEPYPVRYEELTADPAGVTRGILDFLGLDPPGDRDIVPGHGRQSDGINQEWISRYRARAAQVHQT
jgi:trehalose 2-sulfotransferase